MPPAAPFPIADTTPVCQRVDLLDTLATAGASDPNVQAFAARVRIEADKKCAALTAAAAKDSALARTLRNQQACARVTALEALRAVQSLPYVPGPNGVDQYQPAAWTLVHGGECKALVVLLVAVARDLGLTAEPVWITQTGEPLNHVTGRILLDGTWFWADPSIRGAALGESPYEAVKRLDRHEVIRGAGAPGHGGGGHGGHGGGGGFRGGSFGAPFPWVGWGTLWGGWPSWWWCQYYPYLCADPRVILSAPTTVGFYPIATHVVSPAGCACWKIPVSKFGAENPVQPTVFEEEILT